jgi:hypothetical protein
MKTFQNVLLTVIGLTVIGFGIYVIAYTGNSDGGVAKIPIPNKKR